MIKQTMFFLIVLLIFPTLAYAEIWDGQEYKTKTAPPNEILDSVKSEIISQGISEQYFNEHFKLNYASISNAGPVGWDRIETIWNYQINEFSIDDYWVMVNQNQKNEISFSMTTNTLHEIKQTIKKTEAQQKLRECVTEFEWTSPYGSSIKFDIDKASAELSGHGDLFLTTEGGKKVVDNRTGQTSIEVYRATVNLETAELTCEQEIGGIDTTLNQPSKILLPPKSEDMPILKNQRENNKLIYLSMMGGIFLFIVIIYLLLKFRKRH